jgi:glycosyltransferase involved in cell wall biosynthesis
MTDCPRIILQQTEKKAKNTEIKGLISIGLPVYNGQRYIRQSLDSLLAQDYSNFELIISDNASTDETQQICLEYSAKDNRVRYYRNDRNMGAAWNFNRVFELSTGEYFMWASHDDWWAPSYLSSCRQILSSSKSIVLAGVMCESVDDETDKPLFIDKGFSTVGLSPQERLMKYKSTVHAGRHIGALFYGLWKRSLMTDRKPLRRVVGCDQILLTELCFEGEFVTVPEKLMTKRWGGASMSHKKNASAVGTKNPVLVWFPYFVREILLQSIILRTNKLTVGEKFRLCLWSFNHYVRVCVMRSIRRKFQRLRTFGRGILGQLLGNI